MEKYTEVSYRLSQRITLDYSTSFSISSKLFDTGLRPHIYAIYGLVRVADEIVDAYKGNDAGKLLDDLEAETYEALERGFSANPLVHAFIATAKFFSIDHQLIHPFFESMRMDLFPAEYTPNKYKSYIYGSAEVIGLMCLKVFCEGDEKKYTSLQEGAAALGSAYQKVNFLRDFAADYTELGRVYFPDITYETFNEDEKQAIINDIKHDFSVALPALRKLPKGARAATMTSYVYYGELLRRLEAASVESIKQNRLRVPPLKKASLLARTIVKEKLNK